MICPAFSRAAYPHTGDDGAFWPFWRDTGRTIEIDGVATPYQRHVFWSALTNTCFLPSTVFPAAVGKTSGLPIGLQLVGPEFSDMILIDVARLLRDECGYDCIAPPPEALNGAPKL